MIIPLPNSHWGNGAFLAWRNHDPKTHKKKAVEVGLTPLILKSFAF